MDQETADWLAGLTARELTPSEQEDFERRVRRRDLRNAQDQLRRERIRANGAQDRCMRDQVADRDGWICAICGGAVEPVHRAPDPRTPSVDHIVPISLGGTDTLDNVRLVHLFCNMDRLRSRSRETAALRLDRRLRRAGLKEPC
jgi:5-methylcytosine-specific restriction endonuclease McrA